MSSFKPLKRLKGFSRRKNSNTDKHHARDDRSPSTPISFGEASSSIAAVSPNSSSLPKRTSRSPSRPPQATDSLASATPGRVPSSTRHPTTTLSQTGSPPSEYAPSLWSRAYEALRNKDAQLIGRYEKLLSKELQEHTTSTATSPDTPHQNEDLDHAENHINTDPEARQAQLKKITDRGLCRADEKQTQYTIFGHNFVLKDQVAQAAQFIQTIKGLVNEAVKVSPEVSIAWAGVCVLLPVLTNPTAAEEANRNGLSYVTSRICYYVELERLLWPQYLHGPGLKVEFDSHIVDLYQCILEFQIKTVLRFYQRWLTNLGRDVIRYDDWEGMLSEIKEREQIVRDESSTLNTITSRNTLEDISKTAQKQYNDMRSLRLVAKDHLHVSTQHRDVSAHQLTELMLQSQILEDRPIDLPIVHEARYDSADVQDSPKCESGTRLRIRETIHHWADDDSAETLFWLVGPAGTGKSTIARTVADSFAVEKRLIAGYFFKRGEQGRNDTTRLFPTLAMQLAEVIPAFKRCLRKSLDGLDRDAVEKKGLKAQFNQLLWRPLANLSLDSTSQLRGLIIIDALDECERPDHLSHILDLLSKTGHANTICLRVLLTSRPTSAVVVALDSVRYRSLDLEAEHRDETRTDVATFLKQRFASIKTRWDILEAWPDQNQMERLIRLSTTPSPLFIYAATLWRFIDDPDERQHPIDQLDLWFRQCDSNAPQLDQIYLPIIHYVLFGSYNPLERPKPLADNHQTELFAVLGAVVLVATPLSPKAIAALLHIPRHRVTLQLRNLRAVISVSRDPDTPVRLLHKSFSDFFLGSKDSSHHNYGVTAADTHDMLAEKCIQRMKAGLKRDICNVQKLGMSRDEIDKQIIKTHIPDDLEYACLYWAHHLRGSKRPVDHNACAFLHEHFLHWLEVLALLGKVSDGALAITLLLDTFQHFSNTPIGLNELVKDAGRMISSFGSIIESAPLQTYGALLIFSPATSEVRQKFWNQRLSSFSSVQGVKSEWDSHRQTLEGHCGSVKAVGFSPDGRTAASASADETVRLWNAVTGTPWRILKGHGGSVNAVAFSPDGQIIASASRDETVRFWNTATGTYRQALKGHSGSVTAVAFAPKGQVIASASDDKTVRTWDVATGTHQQTLHGHSRVVTA